MTGPNRKIAGATLLEDDCLEVLATLDPESIDAVVTDPPYAIGQLVGERWDEAGMVRVARAGGDRLSAGEAFEAWCRELGEGCFRVLKPGGHMLAFSSPRTVHRLACGVEDAGFEIRDELMWLYGTGIPKSHRLPGGRSTTLKPAYEPIVLARRPLEGTTKETLAAFGTGALNTDACKVSGATRPTFFSATSPTAAGADARRSARRRWSTPRRINGVAAPGLGSRRAASSTARR